MVDLHNGKKLYIIDGSSFLYRAYYGIRPLHTPEGKPVQAVYGFCRMIKKMIDMWNPEYVVLVWDSKGKTNRHEMFPEYKATRQVPPSDLFEQKEKIIEFADAISLCQLSQTGIEADDLIASLTQLWTHQGGNVVIVSADKDMGQLLNDRVMMFDSFKDVMIDVAVFKEKMGFTPDKTIFYFSLIGDSSDNIPGVKGIGPKGALDLLTQFDSLEDMYTRINEVKKERTKELLLANKENAFLSEKLFKMYYYPVECNEDNLKFIPQNWNNVRTFFETLGFKSLLKGLSLAQSVHPQLTAGSQISMFGTSLATDTPPVINTYKTSIERGYQFITLRDASLLDEVIAKIKEKKCFAYDTEGRGKGAVELEMVGLSLCYQEGISYYVPVDHVVDTHTLTLEYVVEKLKPLFEDPTILKIAHHAKFDQLVLRRYGIVVCGPVFDTILAANLVKHEWQKASLKELSYHYLEEKMLTFKEVVEEKKYKHFGHVPLDEATEYAAADSHQTFKLYPIFKKMIAECKQERTLYDLEIPLMFILCDMEHEGIECDIHELEKLDVVVQERLIALKETILLMAGDGYQDINLNSPRQVEQLLFEHFKLPVQKKSAKKTSYSTDNEVLMSLAKIHPVADYLIQYRELFKLQSTYIQALPESIYEKTGRIHTQYSQTRVATGRLASSDPNLQNIPAEGLGAEIRKAFKSPENYLFLSVDYSQIELRVLAYVCQDQELVKAFQENKDIHTQTAAGIFKVPLDEVTKEQRNFGKKINFSIVYGLTSYGLSKDLDISLAQAKEYRDNFFAHYPQLRNWMDRVIAEGKERGYVETLYGRRRMVPGLQEHNKLLYEGACRIAINTVVQGTAAEIMKQGMINVDAMIKQEKLDAKLILQIHDELIIAVHKDDIQKATMKIVSVLESVMNWNVPLKVESLHGKNWFEVS